MICWQDPPGERPARSSSLGPGIGSRYGVALVALGVALLLRYAFREPLGIKAPYLQFYPAIFLAAWYGGLGPGILATTLAAIAAMYSLLPPDGFAVGAWEDRLSLGVFVAAGFFISWLSHLLRVARQAERSAASTATARAERLDAILNITMDGIVVIDAEGRIESFNRGAQELFGYHEPEVIGRHVSILVPPTHREQHDAHLERFLATGDARVIGIGREVTGRRHDGTTFPIELSVGEMWIAGERKFTGMLRDVTKRVGLENALGASEARWRSIVDSAVDGIIAIDGNGAIEAFNPAAERLFGYRRDEVLGCSVDMLVPPPNPYAYDSRVSTCLVTGRAAIFDSGREMQGLRKDGITFPLRLSVGEITNQGKRKFTGIIHDLSSRVQMEAQLREREALARLGEMAAVIAHEVKNPLAGIRGAIQVFGGRMMQEGIDAQILTEIVARIDALDRMMKDLLLFARPPKPNRTPVEVVPLVTTTANLLGEDPEVCGVEIDISGAAPPVFGDADMLRVVFQNLLLNSAHAMRGKGRISIAVAPVETICQITVADEGPGIPPDVREKVFTPFFTTKSRGSGLGLPTVKRFVEAHDGQVAIDCPPSGGTMVCIRLPMDAS